MADKPVESKATKNEVIAIGWVKENKLKVEEDRVMGSIVVQYGKGAKDQAELSVYANRLKKKDKSVNKKYGELVKLNDEMVSMANATEEKPASVISISGNGNFAPKVDLYDSVYNDKVTSRVQLSSGMGNIKITDNIEEKDFRGEFDMVVYLTAAPKRLDDDNVEVKGVFITEDFNTKATAVHPATFIVHEGEVADGIEDGCGKGDTINVWGNTRVASVTTSKKKASGFGGKAKTETNTTTVSELEITGGIPIDEDDKRAITTEFIKKALVERESMLENLAKEGSKPQDKKKSGFGGDGSTANPRDKF